MSDRPRATPKFKEDDLLDEIVRRVTRLERHTPGVASPSGQFDPTRFGDIISADWDGNDKTTLDLSSADSTASQGYALDSDKGAAQFEGNVYVGGTMNVSGTLSVAGDIVLTGDGNIVTTTGIPRIEIVASANDRIQFYSSNYPNTNKASIQATSNGILVANGISVTASVFGGSISWDLLNSNQMSMILRPPDDGNANHVYNLKGYVDLRGQVVKLPIASGTPPTGITLQEGMMYVDTSDNALYIYTGAAWSAVHSW